MAQSDNSATFAAGTENGWLRAAAFCAVLVLSSGTANAATHLVGHQISLTKYREGVGKQYRITIRAERNGNPAILPFPADPSALPGGVTVQRDGGVLNDPLTAGTWTGLGNPKGSKGWKYRNKDAPVGGEVNVLILKATMIRLVTKGVGTMPLPAAPNGTINTVILVGGDTYCAEATTPHYKEVDDETVRSKDQTPPASCPPCILGLDSDEDRLDNCHETNTGVHVGPTDTGTDPLNPDTDDDGMDDGDEVLGTLGGLDLLALGASPLRKDILVEYDWFDDSLEFCGAHSHRPTAGTVAMVTTTFSSAPVLNPDGSSGINFIHDYGQGGLFTGGNLIVDANGILVAGVEGAEFKNYKLANFATNRNGYFRYVILPHRYDTDSDSSGQAELPGDDMIVSLYCFHSDYNVATTIVHELGHNLTLRHGGDEFCNYKPNYNSVMNYRYQFPGIDTNCNPLGNGVIDYSIGSRIDLDETNLDESMGTCGAPSWDWNSNSVIESGIAFDINSDETLQGSTCGAILSTLRDHDDWANISFGGLANFDGAAVMPIEVIDCDNPPPH